MSDACLQELMAQYPSLNRAQFQRISGWAYERGHSAGQAEVDLHARNITYEVYCIIQLGA